MDPLLTAVIGAYLIVNTAGIAANLIVIILIYTSTPANLKLFSLLLLNMAVIDFIANFAGLFSILRLQPIEDGLVISCHGLCHYMSHTVCLISYCTMISFHIHSTLSLPISFFYRWWILSHSAPSKMVVIGALLAVTPLSSMEFASCIRCLDDNLTELVDHSSQPVGVDHDLLIGFSTFKNPYAAQTMFYLVFVFPIVYCIVFVIRRCVLNTLEKAGLSHAAVSYDMHKKLLMVLTLQAVVPLGLMLCGLQYFYSQLFDQNVLVMQYLTVLPVNCVSLLQPLITLYFVAPYRKALSTLFGNTKPILKPSLWTTTHVTTLRTLNEQH